MRLQKKIKFSQGQIEEIAGYLFILPWIIGFIAFQFGPLVAAFVISFTRWTVLAPPVFSGLKNYQELVSDPLFWQSLKVTVVYTGGNISIRIGLGMVAALLVNQKIKGIGIYRTLYYLPAVVPTIALSILWLGILAPFGLVNYIFSVFDLPNQMWLKNSDTALLGLILLNIWGIGVSMVVFLGALQGIPVFLYEAADVEGASSWQKFWKITFPMISPMILLTLIVNFVGSFQSFTQAYVITDGGPSNSTLFYILYLYRQSFQYLHMGYGCTLAVMLFIFILFLTLIVVKSSSLWVFYRAEKK